nr:exocyst complex component SEC8 [Ipomoea batatas]
MLIPMMKEAEYMHFADGASSSSSGVGGYIIYNNDTFQAGYRQQQQQINFYEPGSVDSYNAIDLSVLTVGTEITGKLYNTAIASPASFRPRAQAATSYSSSIEKGCDDLCYKDFWQ